MFTTSFTQAFTYSLLNLCRIYFTIYSYKYFLDLVHDNVQDEQPVQTKTAPQGSTIVMDCRTDLVEPITYHWSKPGGSLPREVHANSVSYSITE